MDERPPDARSKGMIEPERASLVLALQKREAKLEEQARIFIPLIALTLVFAIPVWSKSLDRFLKLLLSPFVLLPVGFCLAHLMLAWRKIVIARNRIRRMDRAVKEGEERFDE